MSFSFDTKYELCEFNLKKECCKVSQLYGICMFAQQLNQNHLKLTTENVMVINVLNTLANNVLNINFAIDENINSYYAELSGDALSLLYDRFFINVNGRVEYHISHAITENSCCSYAFLRGAFLSGGYVSNPKDRYHLEISTPFYSLAKSLQVYMKNLDFPAKTVVRKSNYVVYMKDSDAIERFLCLIGANSSAFAVMDAKIYKEVSNNSNRINNVKIHNIEKTINKSVEQIKCIEKIVSKIGLDSLEPDLKMAAKLRLDNPDKSLNELVSISSNLFSRSGLNRKLNKLIEIAQRLGD